MRWTLTWRSLRILLAVSALVVAFDWFTKEWASQQGWIVLENSGISFGMWQEHGAFWSALIPVIWVVILLLLVFKELPTNPWPNSLLVGGGLANLLDRALTGGVRDWLPVPFTSIYNNLADWAIITAFLWIWVQTLRLRGQKSRLDEDARKSIKTALKRRT